MNKETASKMYTVATLLAEEPEKFEKLVFVFLKMLVTLLVTSVLFDFNLSIPELGEKFIPQSYSISRLIYFIILTIIVWFVIWEIIAEIILGEFVIWALSKIGNRKTIFNEVLGIFNVVKTKNNNIGPAKNIIIFNDLLQTYSTDGEKFINESKARARQYYIISTVVYFSMLFAADIFLPNWFKWMGVLLIINFLISSLTLHLIHSYLSLNLEDMKKQFSRLSYAQMVINTIEKNSFIKQNYNRRGDWTRITLERKTDFDWLPEILSIYPFYHWNELLAKTVLDLGLQEVANKHSNKENNYTYRVLVSNMDLNSKNISNILANPQFVYMKCQNEEQMMKNIEILMFKITNGNYSIDNI